MFHIRNRITEISSNRENSSTCRIANNWQTGQQNIHVKYTHISFLCMFCVVCVCPSVCVRFLWILTYGTNIGHLISSWYIFSYEPEVDKLFTVLALVYLSGRIWIVHVCTCICKTCFTYFRTVCDIVCSLAVLKFPYACTLHFHPFRQTMSNLIVLSQEWNDSSEIRSGLIIESENSSVVFSGAAWGGGIMV